MNADYSVARGLVLERLFVRPLLFFYNACYQTLVIVHGPGYICNKKCIFIERIESKVSDYGQKAVYIFCNKTIESLVGCGRLTFSLGII